MLNEEGNKVRALELSRRSNTLGKRSEVDACVAFNPDGSANGVMVNKSESLGLKIGHVNIAHTHGSTYASGWGSMEEQAESKVIDVP